MSDWQQDNWSNYNQQQDWNTQPADGFQQFDYSNYSADGSYSQQQGTSDVPYLQPDSGVYSGSMFIPDSAPPPSYKDHQAPGGGSGFEDEPPLLEELGINPDYIMQKTLTVLNPMGSTDAAVAGDSDLAGPLSFCLAFGSFLMLSGKPYFNYIYGIGLLGSVAMYALLNLMSIGGVSICTVVSVLGYCLLPMVGLSGLSILFQLTGILGNILTAVAVLWCTLSSSKLFVTALEMRDQQLLVAYPCGILYGVFALITMF